MKTGVASLVIIVVCASFGFDQAQAGTEEEVTQTIIESFAHLNEQGTVMPDSYSKHGALEFWSSGGLLIEVTNRRADVFEAFSLQPKHLRVITLVEDEAAVALYYSEGSMKPKGYPAVSHYLTRVTQAFVKEDGQWKIRSSHWSPVGGGSGTSHASVVE